jgi:hypothetical protein
MGVFLFFFRLSLKRGAEVNEMQHWLALASVTYYIEKFG